MLRLFLAGNLEFGNDEVYYWLYAKYPDLSHFDHPPMVGFFIQFFTGNLYFDSEFFIRLAAIIPTSINMYVVFLIGSYIKSGKARSYCRFIISLTYLWVYNCWNIYSARCSFSILLVAEFLFFYASFAKEA